MFNILNKKYSEKPIMYYLLVDITLIMAKSMVKSSAKVFIKQNQDRSIDINKYIKKNWAFTFKVFDFFHFRLFFLGFQLVSEVFSNLPLLTFSKSFRARGVNLLIFLFSNPIKFEKFFYQFQVLSFLHNFLF